MILDNSKLKIAVIGCGSWGKKLFTAFYEVGFFPVICDVDEKKLNWYENHYPNLQTYHTAEKVLIDPSIEAVAIASPFENHFEFARKALLAGKHVYFERPLMVTADQREELGLLSREQKRVLTVAGVLKHYPVFSLLQEIVAKGELGNLKYIYASRLSAGEIGEDENILWSFSPHDVAMILGLSGELPEFVAATGANYFHKKIADLTTSYMKFPSGLRAHLFVSWLHPENNNKLVVVGDKKMAVFQDKKNSCQKLYIYPHQISWEHEMHVPQKAKAEIINIYQDELICEDIERFVSSVKEQRGAVNLDDEGEQVMEILNAGQLSINQNGDKVFLGAGRQFGIMSMPLPIIDAMQQGKMLADGVTLLDEEQTGDMDHEIICDEELVICNDTTGSFLPFYRLTKDGKGCKIRNNLSIIEDLLLESEFEYEDQNLKWFQSSVFLNQDRNDERQTVVKKGVTLGAGCTIARGTTIGEYAYIGAGAVVVNDVPPHALVVGSPAKIKGWVCRCGNRLRFSRDDKSCCSSCCFRYIVEEDDILFVTGAGDISEHHNYLSMSDHERIPASIFLC